MIPLFKQVRILVGNQAEFVIYIRLVHDSFSLPFRLFSILSQRYRIPLIGITTHSGDCSVHTEFVDRFVPKDTCEQSFEFNPVFRKQTRSLHLIEITTTEYGGYALYHNSDQGSSVAAGCTFSITTRNLCRSFISSKYKSVSEKGPVVSLDVSEANSFFLY